MVWVPREGFESRTTQHLKEVLGHALSSAQNPLVVTHATRGEIKGRTTYILTALKNHGLQEVTMMRPEDAPHNCQGYAFERSVSKQKRIAELLSPWKKDLMMAMRSGRVLVEGRFQQKVLRRLGVDFEDVGMEYFIPYPNRWINMPIEVLHKKLSLVLKDSVPSRENLSSYLVQAHRNALKDRWNRMSKEQKNAFRKMLREAYELLPPEEKERRSQQAREVTSEFWKRQTSVEKLQRLQACLSYRRSQQGSLAWRTALKAAKQRMLPEVKERVLEKLHEGYSKRMTPEKQASTGFKRRVAWTSEKKEEARTMMMKNSKIRENLDTNIKKARKALGDPAILKRTVDKTLTTKALKIAEAVNFLQSRLDEDPSLCIDRKERRTIREGCQRSLEAHNNGRLTVDDCCIKILEEGIKIMGAAGALSKSSGLKRRW